MSDGVGRRVRKNTGMMVAAKGVAAVMALGGLAFAARGMSTEAFGLLVFMHAFVLLFTEIATFESWLVVVRYAAGGETGVEAARKDPARFGRVISFCVTLDLLAASAAFVVALVAALSLSGAIDILGEATPLLFLYAALIFLNQKSASLGVLRLFDRYDLIALNSLTIPFVRMTGCGAAWALGAPFEAYVAAWFASSALSYLILPWLAVRELRRNGLLSAAMGGGLSLRAPAPGLWRFVGFTNVDSALGAGGAQMPVILAGIVGGPAFAAIFRVAQEVAIVLAKAALMIDKVVFPEFTNLIAKGEGARVPGLVLRTGAAMMAAGCLVGLVFWWAGPAFLSVALGPAYAQATGLAVVLIVAASIAAAAGPLFPAFYAAGLPHRAILARAAGLSTMIVGFFVLYAAYGRIGPGFAVASGAVVTLLIAVYIARRCDWSRLVSADEAADQVGDEAADQRDEGQTERSASRISAASTEAEADRTGGPGQPGSSSGRSAA